MLVYFQYFHRIIYSLRLEKALRNSNGKTVGDSSVFLCRESSGYTEHTGQCITGNWLNQTNHFGHLLDLKDSTKEPVLVLDAAL